MDDDDREFVRSLMAKATAILEEAIKAPIAGQSPNATRDELADDAGRLHAVVLDIAAIAQAAATISTAGLEGQRGSRGRTS